MQFGVCGDPALAPVAAHAGFDYLEGSVGGLLKPREPESAFEAALKVLREAPLPCPALNGLMPGDQLKITGKTADLAQLRKYVATTLERAERAGVRIIVFGSGGARQVPEGFGLQDARDQLTAFCAMLGPIAQRHGVTIVVEPLNRAECNILNTVSECAILVRNVGHPAVRLLVDAYHFLRESDSYADIVASGDIVAHAHVATSPVRRAPAAEPCDFAPFFQALARAGYNGRVSIEAGLREPAVELPAALALLKSLALPPRDKAPEARP